MKMNTQQDKISISNEEMKNRKRQRMISLALLTAGALLAMLVRFLPTVNAAYIVCPWIYLPCFLYVSRKANKVMDYIIWIVFWCGSFVIRYWGILSSFNRGASILLQLAGAVVYALPFLLDRVVCRKSPGAVALLVFPFAFASLDYVLELLELGSLFSLAQTQFDNKPFLQIAAILGSKGIVFLLALSASFLVHNRKHPKRLLIWLLVILLLHAGGQVRINLQKPVIDASDQVTIGWSAEPVHDDASFFYETIDATLDTNVGYLRDALDEAKTKRVQLLCFPEESFYIEAADHDGFLQAAQELAAEYRISLLLSVESDSFDNGEKLGINHALFIDTEGNIQEDYQKTMLIPVAEAPYYTEGAGVLPEVDVRIGQTDLVISYAICFDGDFGSYVRTVSDKANLFVDVSWDWDPVDELHYRIIGLRAVENGLTVVKPTIGGYSTVTDYLGRLHSKTHTDETGYQGVNTVNLPLAKQSTIYHKVGNLIDGFYIAGLIICTFVIVFCSIKRRRNGN